MSHKISVASYVSADELEKVHEISKCSNSNYEIVKYSVSHTAQCIMTGNENLITELINKGISKSHIQEKVIDLLEEMLNVSS